MQTPVSLDGVPSRMIWRPSTEGVQTLDGRLDTIRGWFEECQKNHPKCMQNPNLELPTRLIDVGSDSHPIRLVDVKSLGDSSSVVYAALSHCWGSKLDSHFVTTVKNEAVQRDKIDLASLPGTYRDAIMVTRKLGLRYIWVDSLCIIQENIADWEFESSHMGSVFEGAFISLAATDAEDGDGGLFLTSLEAPLQVKYDSGAQPALVRCPAADAEKLHNAPLSSRAWALQEVILSKRTIHFTKDQLFWQCHTLFLSEDGIIQQDKFGSLRFSIVFKTLDFKDTHAALRYWWMWMQDYSARKLTYHQDWLAAIAGITQYFADETGLTPLLGMWRESLLEDLAWYTNVEGSRSEIPNMPSWSWLRHEKRICEPPSQGCARSRAYSEIRKIDIGWTATPLTSPIKYTTLIVWGPIVHLKFRLLESIKSQGGGWVLSDQDIPEFSLFHLDEKVASQSAREVFEAPCLALSTYHRTYSLDKDRQSHGLGIFLALRKVDSKLGETPKYERLGMGQWDATPGKSNPLDGVESSLIELL